ncbi:MULTISPECIES: deaminase [Actinomadura]|uniref:Cytidine and deoxycytidylate deaminase zinc-binding region n=1 Tax=Actinomadura madurae TaxID=1993 RepID=A0A1I4ZHZ5_9ACTN|nr:nucleoside deaminase [Actinomadura madurae]SFN49609.1 Cytidine and deoxycytidylate deaminase zinc-binding region [Actinomadura madurae]SPT49814.1 Guanine deaminase [Actinomadura madurae]
MTYEPTAAELVHLNRCVELAAEALEAADEPFGTVLVSASGEVLFEDRNRTADGDQTRHPEFEVARWAARNMAPEDRADAVVFTSGEHCPMCSAAHGWVGLGRIVYIHSSAQVSAWRSELGVPPGPVNAIPIQEVVPGIRVDGPVAALEAAMRELHTRACS